MNLYVSIKSQIKAGLIDNKSLTDESNTDPSKATIKVFYKGVSDASDAL